MPGIWSNTYRHVAKKKNTNYKQKILPTNRNRTRNDSYLQKLSEKAAVINLMNMQRKSESGSHSVVSNSLQPHGLDSPWNSPGQNTGAGSHSLLQSIFPTQGLNPGLPHCRQILYQLSHKGSPYKGNISTISRETEDMKIFKWKF